MSAIFSPCGRWRYRLDREGWFGDGRVIAFGLHNPSIAGAKIDDPTSRRGIGFTKAWGASRLVYVNPWAWCATNPSALWLADDPIGPDNSHHIAAVAREVRDSGGFFVFAWGAVNPPPNLRPAAMLWLHSFDKLVRGICPDVRALGLTKDGHPRHPLYLRSDSEPVPFAAVPIPSTPSLNGISGEQSRTRVARKVAQGSGG